MIKNFSKCKGTVHNITSNCSFCGPYLPVISLIEFGKLKNKAAALINIFKLLYSHMIHEAKTNKIFKLKCEQ